MNFKNIFIIGCFLAICNFGVAQKTVNVVITDSLNNIHLDGLELYLLENNQIEMTDKNGLASFIINDTFSFVTIVISDSNYDYKEQIISTPNTKNDTTLMITRISEIGVVVKKGNKTTSNSRNLKFVEGTSIYAAKKNEIIVVAEKTSNKATNNARQLYSKVSGLNIFDGNDGGLQLNIGGRGLDPNRTSNFNTRQNGYDISADVLGYPESYYSSPAEDVNEIQVIRGAASLQYGTQFGGLVNFKMNKPLENKPLQSTTRLSYGSYNFASLHQNLTGTLGKFGYYVSYLRKQGDGTRPHAGYHSNTIFSTLSYKISDQQDLSLDITHMDYLAQQPGGLTDKMFYEDAFQSNRARNWFSVQWNLLSLKYQYEISKKDLLSINAFGLLANRKSVGFRTNRVSQIDDESYVRDLIIGAFKNYGFEAKYLKKYTLFDKNDVFLIGGKWYQSNNTAFQGAGSSGSSANFTPATEEFPFYTNQSDFTYPNKNLALFVENIFYLTDALTVTPGLRFEHINTKSSGEYKVLNFDGADNVIFDQDFEDSRTFERQILIGGLGISYKKSQKFEWFANISQNYRSVTFNDLRTTNPSFKIADDITDEKGYTADSGIRGRWNKTFRYDISGFHINYDNKIGETLVEEDLRVIRLRDNIGSAAIYGLESLVDVELSHLIFPAKDSTVDLNLFSNLAYTRATYNKSQSSAILGNTIEFVPRINFKSGLEGRWKNFKLATQFTYISEQFTDATNAEQNVADNTRGIEGTIPAYYVMDLSLTQKIKKITVEASVNNLLNQTYFTRRATGYPGPGILTSDPRTFYVTLQVQL